MGVVAARGKLLSSAIASAVCGFLINVVAIALAAAAPQTPSDNITAESTVRKALDRARTTRGGPAKLASVRTLLAEGSRRPEAGTSFLFTYRILFPDRFQEVSFLTATLDGGRYWQRPRVRRDAESMVRGAKLRLFAEQSLVLLLRAPASLPVKASAVRLQWQGVDRPGIRFLGAEDFDITMVIGYEGEPIGYAQPVSLGTDAGVQKLTREVAFAQFADVGGIKFPRHLSETIGQYKARIEYSRLLVDSGIGADVFIEPK